jgi:hypothetical protein
LEHGCRYSTTFRALVAHIEASDVVVYVQIAQSERLDSAGRTAFIVAAGGRLYIHVSLNSCVFVDALVGLLGHELQHAVEIADAREVIDDATLIKLYERIGRRRTVQVGQWQFDTAAAVAVGRRVMGEVAMRTFATDQN